MVWVLTLVVVVPLRAAATESGQQADQLTADMTFRDCDQCSEMRRHQDEEWVPVHMTFRDCAQCPEMVVVPAGSFIMGSAASEPGRYVNEGPTREVTIPDDFAVGVYEVTFREWDACIASGGCNGYRPNDAGWGRGLRPVINLSWQDTQSWLHWLSARTGHDYRLLSEAEWEYVARAGTTRAFYTGDQLTTDQANFDGSRTYNGSPAGAARNKTLEVGTFPANPFGLYDVYGNAWEWVEDCWNDSYATVPVDASANPGELCPVRALRGGAWYNNPRDLRSAHRFWFRYDLRYVSFGFRIARTLKPEY